MALLLLEEEGIGGEFWLVIVDAVAEQQFIASLGAATEAAEGSYSSLVHSNDNGAVLKPLKIVIVERLGPSGRDAPGIYFGRMVAGGTLNPNGICRYDIRVLYFQELPPLFFC